MTHTILLISKKGSLCLGCPALLESHITSEILYSCFVTFPMVVFTQFGKLTIAPGANNCFVSFSWQILHTKRTLKVLVLKTLWGSCWQERPRNLVWDWVEVILNTYSMIFFTSSQVNFLKLIETSHSSLRDNFSKTKATFLQKVPNWRYHWSGFLLYGFRRVMKIIYYSNFYWDLTLKAQNYNISFY